MSIDNKARIFIADIGKIPLNHEVTLETMYVPEHIFNWIIEGFTEYEPSAMTVITSGKVSILGLVIYRHSGDRVLCVSSTGVAEVTVDVKLKKILAWRVSQFKVAGQGKTK